MIGSWFDQHEEEWGVLAGVEGRTQVSASRVRLPGVVVAAAAAHPKTLVDPPLIVIEVLSPGDNYTEIERRAQDYRRMGVPNIWLIDPDTRTAASAVSLPGPRRCDLPSMTARSIWM
jgi:Uma2 family endonuclease